MFTSIVVQNFGTLPDASFPLGRINRVTGKNGAGKTSVGRALLWALTGLGLDGNAAAAAYLRDPANTCLVRLENEDGEAIERRRVKSGGYVTVNRERIPEDGLRRLLHMSPLTFLTMAFPETFFRLSPAKRREVLLDATPEENMQALFEELCPGVKAASLDWKRSPRLMHETANLKRLAIERDLAQNRGRLTELERLAGEIAAEGGVTMKELEERRDELARQYRAACDREAELRDLQKAAAESERYFEEWKRKADARSAAIKENEERAKKAKQLIDIDKLGSKLRTLEAGAKANCPTCGQPVRDEAVEKARAEFSEAKRKNAALGDLTPVLVPEVGPAPTTMAAPTPEEVYAAQGDARAWASKLGEVNARINAKTRANAAQEQREKNLRDLEEDHRKLKEEYENARRVEAALHPDKGIWARALQRKLAKVCLPGFRFVFSETLEGGATKQEFKVLRESDRLDVEDMSSGERIKFCLSLSCLIADLTGTPFRIVFLEHTDLLDGVPALPGFQVFAERVVKGAALALEVVK